MGIFGETYDTSAPERIVAAACIVRGQPWFLPPPCRHHHILWTAAQAFPGEMLGPDDQGFWTSHGRYVGRLEAVGIAKAAGQITEPQWPPDLYSEDLW